MFWFFLGTVFLIGSCILTRRGNHGERSWAAGGRSVFDVAGFMASPSVSVFIMFDGLSLG
jgi:hypothetical protein